MTLAKREKYLGICPSCGLLVRESQPHIRCEKLGDLAEEGFYHEKCLARIMKLESREARENNYLRIKQLEFDMGVL